MKNGAALLLVICLLSLTFVTGVFLGRNFTNDYRGLEAGSAAQTLAETEDEAYLVDINNASKAELMELPGIGELLAQRIIAYRTENGPFQTTDGLLDVEGIGEKKLTEIESMIKAGGYDEDSCS